MFCWLLLFRLIYHSLYIEHSSFFCRELIRDYRNSEWFSKIPDDFRTWNYYWQVTFQNANVNEICMKKIRVSLDLFNRPGIICGTMCIARRGCPSAATVISWYFIVFILAWAFCVYACAKWAKLRTNNRQITIGICVHFIVQVVGPSCDLSSPLTIKGHTHTQPYKHRVELAQFS